MASRFSVEAVFKMVDRFTRPVVRMQNRFKVATDRMHRGLRNVNRSIQRFGKSIGGATLKLGKLTAVGSGVGAGLLIGLNRASVRTQQLTEGLGIATNTAEGLAAAIAPAGLELDHIVDLVEEMNNKLGESAGLEEILPVTEALTILGLQFEKIRKLSPERQFRQIANAALQMEDAQKAASALDILFGGEANKVISVLRLQGRSVDEIIARFDKLNFRTAESRTGAQRFTFAMGELFFAVRSVSQEIAGLLGDALTPLIQQFLNWVRVNREFIRTQIADSIQKIVQSITELYRWLKTGEAERWFNNILTATKWVGGLIVALQALAAVLLLINTIMWANPIRLVIGAVVVLIAFSDKLLASFEKFHLVLKLAFAPVWAALKGFKLIRDVVAGLFADGKIDSTEVGASVTSPQSRTANILEERKTLEQTSVVIKDETGRAQVESGGTTQGLNFTFLPSGAF